MLLEKAKLLPELPGCYLMLNQREEILYVGKAKNLKNRVSSYFSGQQKSLKTFQLLQNIVDFNFILTKNEAEAFILENTLIKKHMPKYNLRLKDDRSYPYAVIDRHHPFPQLQFMRKPKARALRQIIGPFALGDRLGEIIPLLNKIYQLRQCSDQEFSKRKTPCLLYQIKQCSAPCVGLIEKDEYAKTLESAEDVILRKNRQILHNLEKNMQDCAEKEEYEMASFLRDGLKLIEEFQGKELQQFGELSAEFAEMNADIVDYYAGEKSVDVVFYLIRQGRLTGHQHFFFSKNYLDLTESDELEKQILSFLLWHYTQEKYSSLPIIHLPFSTSLSEIFYHALKIEPTPLPPQIALDLHPLVKRLAQEIQRQRESMKHSPEEGLNELQKLLKFPTPLRTIDALDVAVFQGDSPTGSVVRFHDGVPDKKNYRFFHLVPRDEGNNDFAMLEELLERCLKKKHYPDLLLIDGGTPQINRLLQVLKRHNLNIPIIGLAKERVVKKGSINRIYEERLIIPGRKNPVILAKSGAMIKVLTHLRDEAHRFCRKLHHSAETNRFFDND